MKLERFIMSHFLCQVFIQEKAFEFRLCSCGFSVLSSKKFLFLVKQCKNVSKQIIALTVIVA